MLTVIRDKRTGAEIQVFFSVPEFQTELNPDRSVSPYESALYTGASETNGGYAVNTAAWD